VRFRLRSAEFPCLAGEWGSRSTTTQAAIGTPKHHREGPEVPLYAVAIYGDRSKLRRLRRPFVCYRDAWESTHPGESGHTFTPRNPLVAGGEMPLELARRIDYVMVRCEDHGPTLDVSSCERIFDEPVGGVWASDHFGVVADLSAQTPSGRAVQ
jgi:hypothetical protein